MSSVASPLTNSENPERFDREQNTGVVKEEAQHDASGLDDVPTLDEIYRRHAHQVARYAARLAGPRLDHEDVVHDVFMVVQRRLPEFRGEAQMSTWLFRITMHVVQGLLRKQRMRGLLPFRLLEQHAPMAQQEPTPAEALQGRREAELCYRILDKLPYKQRTAMILFELDGKSGEEIAQAMGAPVDTIWVWLHRGRQAFLKHITRLQARGEA